MMKVFTIEARTDKTNKKGLCPVRIKVTEGGNRSYIATDIQVIPQLWDKDKQKVKPNHPDADAINKKILVKLLDLQRAEEEEDLTYPAIASASVIEMYVTKAEERVRKEYEGKIQELMKLIPVKNIKRVNYFDYYNNYCDWVENNMAVGTAKRYKSNMNKFKEFYTAKELYFDQFDLKMVREFEGYLRNTVKNNNATILSTMKTFSKVWTVAVNEGMVAESDNPFKKWGIKLERTKREHLTEEQLETIEKLTLAGWKYKAQLVFLFGCYTGLRISDMCCLTWDKVKDGCLEVKMMKTGEWVEIPLIKKAQDILDRMDKSSRFIFPLFKENINLQDKKEVQVAISRATSLVNNELKDLKKVIKMDKLTVHISRHTFATLALSRGMAIHLVQRILGHNDLKTTAIYSKIIQKDVDREMRKAFE